MQVILNFGANHPSWRRRASRPLGGFEFSRALGLAKIRTIARWKLTSNDGVPQCANYGTSQMGSDCAVAGVNNRREESAILSRQGGASSDLVCAFSATGVSESGIVQEQCLLSYRIPPGKTHIGPSQGWRSSRRIESASSVWWLLKISPTPLLRPLPLSRPLGISAFLVSLFVTFIPTLRSYLHSTTGLVSQPPVDMSARY